MPVRLLLAILLLATTATAQGKSPAPDPLTGCQDQVRLLRVLVNQYVNSRQRLEIDAAQEIANLTKALEQARVDLERERAGKKP